MKVHVHTSDHDDIWIEISNPMMAPTTAKYFGPMQVRQTAPVIQMGGVSPGPSESYARFNITAYIRDMIINTEKCE